tara:strand:+ start:188 stop:790 length:603 start_codon:yes stop_codon:yes gene_type:complete
MPVIASSSLSAVVGKNPYQNRLSSILYLLRKDNYIQKNVTEKQNVNENSPTNLGIKNEPLILKQWASENNYEISNTCTSKIKLFDIKQEWLLSGRPDAILTNGDLVEIKYRTSNTNFNSIPIYDWIQVQSYLHIFNTKTCHYVQSFDGNLKYDIIEKDDVYWYKHLIPNVLEYAAIYESLCDNPTELQTFLYYASLETFT